MLTFPTSAYVVFGLAVILAVAGVFKASGYNRGFLLGILLWMSLQSVLSIGGFYVSPKDHPLRFPMLIVPPLFFLLVTLITPKGRRFLDGFDISILTLLHTVRILVEVTL
jgi:hypothetical protein